MRERDYDVLSLLHRRQARYGHNNLEMDGNESHHPQCTVFFGLLPIFVPDQVLTCSEPNFGTLVHLKANQDPRFQADQSSVVWSAPEFE